MAQGIIIKGIGGFYYVRISDRTIECKARGKFRNEGITPIVGDYVDVIENDSGSIIDRIYPRKTELQRPPVANVEQAVIVFSCTKPNPNLNLLDRFLLSASHNKLNTVICINKIDLDDINDIYALTEPYKCAGYKILYTSTRTMEGLDTLKQQLKNSITVFAGPSGVGKSSLINSLQPSLNLKTGSISDKLERGKHTTRHCELMELNEGGFIVDTPGFSSIDMDYINKEDLEYLFPDFEQYLNSCRFYGCSHISEPDCAIKEAVAKKLIHPSRYESYKKLYDEISKIRRNYK